MQQMQEQMNSLNDSGDFQDVESNYSGRLSHVSCKPVMIPSSRSLLSRDTRLPLDTWNLDYRKTILEINFLRLIHPEIILKEFNLTMCKETGKQSPQPERRRLQTSEDRLNQGTIPMRTLATMPLTTSSTMQVELPQNFMVGQQRQQISELQFDKFPNPQSFWLWKMRFKIQVTTCSDFPSDATLWMKEVEMVDSFDELKSSRSACGKFSKIFDMLDAKVASALKKIIHNSQFKKKVTLEEQKAKKEDQCLRGRQIAFMIFDYFRLVGAHDTVLDYADLFSVTLRDDNVQEFFTRWDELLWSMSKIPSDDVLESL